MNGNSNTTSKGAVIFLSHGGGPLPLLGDAAHHEMLGAFARIAAILDKPAAIIVISAHWEETQPSITSAAFPPLIYDYYGFPEESYTIQYPAPGEPLLARRIFTLLRGHGIAANLDDKRGFDHGLFVPLKILYPKANIPCVQLSLVKTLQPEEHIRIGRALAGLREDNVLIVGSGFSFHNLKAFFAPATQETRALNEAFEQWLVETCASLQLSETERERKLIDWQTAPAARFCHPREEHLLPLHVCYGAAGSAARQVFRFEIMGIRASAFLW